MGLNITVLHCEKSLKETRVEVHCTLYQPQISWNSIKYNITECILLVTFKKIKEENNIIFIKTDIMK